MDCPDGCPEVVYNIMKQCWNLDPAARPSFQMLKELLQHISHKKWHSSVFIMNNWTKDRFFLSCAKQQQKKKKQKKKERKTEYVKAKILNRTLFIHIHHVRLFQKQQLLMTLSRRLRFGCFLHFFLSQESIFNCQNIKSFL